MRIPSLLRPAVAISVAAVALAGVASSADAADEADVVVKGNQIVVTAKGNWHINKDYPWRLVIGDKKVDASQFQLSDKSATVTAPKGTGKIKGGVCSGEQCLIIEEAVTVR